MTTICIKCAKKFTWEETDAIVKDKYGTRYLVPCPHCKKINIIYQSE
jgi:endogenous inhibitor of DNA gyrase (YacG/DUF329 family)